jgi:hypothetical protein
MEQEKPPKKRGPKPKIRRPQDRIEQVTLRIGIGLKTALELVRRDLHLRSINETIDWCLRQCLLDYDLDGKSAFELGDRIENIETARFKVAKSGPLLKQTGLSSEELAQVIAEFMRETGLYRVQNTPARLRTAEEEYVLKVYEDDLGLRKKGDLRGAEEWRAIRERIAEGFRRGDAPEEVRKELMNRKKK